MVNSFIDGELFEKHDSSMADVPSKITMQTEIWQIFEVC